MWHEVAKLDDIAPGGMKYVRAGEDDREICLCEYDGDIYAVSRRCGHENAPLADGALEGPLEVSASGGSPDVSSWLVR